MIVVLILLAIVFFIAYIALHKSADKMDEKFANRPTIINDPSKDLMTNQKYAIVGLLAWVQGASERSAYDSECSNLLQSTIFRLGLSRSQVEDYLKVSMSQSPETCLRRIVDSLREIRDKNYLEEIFSDAKRIAVVSGDQDTIEAIREMHDDIINN